MKGFKYRRPRALRRRTHLTENDAKVERKERRVRRQVGLIVVEFVHQLTIHLVAFVVTFRVERTAVVQLHTLA